MSIYKTILARGYFPKELPPAFNTRSFADFATTKPGRAAIAAYKPREEFTECCEFRVARTGNESREFKVPHPYHFAELARICSKSFQKLLKKAGASPFASSSPCYGEHQSRAIQSRTAIGNLARDKSLSRAGSSFLMRADISHFYPSLYTHAIGWAIDPKLRDKKYWHDKRILGKQIDQTLMNLDRKFSQGIPIGNDLSFLLAETVLAAVDSQLPVIADRAFRYYDDYEIACSSEEEARRMRECLESELAKFRLRLNPTKTQIIKLPVPAQDEWQESILSASRAGLRSERDLIRYFDTAFRQRLLHPHAAILSFALSVLFRLQNPGSEQGRIVESAISQALLCEPGSCQKALSLLSYWKLNGYQIDNALFSRTISALIMQCYTKGTHDLVWALSFCLDNGIPLDEPASARLQEIDNDMIAILSLHLQRKRLLAKSFDGRAVSRLIRGADLDREHWLLGYEGSRLGFVRFDSGQVAGNTLFASMFGARVNFYETRVPSHSFVVAQGGAPNWLIRSWIKRANDEKLNQRLPKNLRSLIQHTLAEHRGVGLTVAQFRVLLSMNDAVIPTPSQVEMEVYE